MTTNKLSNQGTNNGYMIGKQINNYSEYVRVPTFLTALIKKLCKVLDSEVNEAKLELLPFTPEEKIWRDYHRICKILYDMWPNFKHIRWLWDGVQR